MTDFTGHMEHMMSHPVWDMMGRVLVAVMAAGIVALVGLQWSTQASIADIRTDIAVIKVNAEGGAERRKAQLSDHEARLRTLERRVR